VRGPNAEDTAVATREETAHAGSPRDGSLHDGSPRDESARDDSRVERGAGAQGNRPSPRVEMYAYRPDFTSANPDAPAFAADLRRRLESGAREAGDVVDSEDKREITAAVRMRWPGGPCAIVLAWRHADRPAFLALNELGFGALLAGALVIAVLVAVVPVERRIRKLTAGVQSSAAGHYREAVAVEGSDELGELARAFNTAALEVRTYIDELEKRERSLRDFVQNTTHDVMLPLTVLQGHLTEIRDAVARGTTPPRALVRDALEESHYLASLVQNLVVAARLENGRPDRRHDEFAWNQLVERVVQRHEPIARAKEVELDFAAPERDVRAQGDVTMVEQALSNVVHNAVRYNKAGGHVAILLEAGGGRFSVRVFDDGPGVKESELTRIADRAFRGDAARARQPEGMGLGLSIAKDVADRHEFTFELRRAEAGGLEVEIGGPALAS
jgi:signal transduction histidine kinase